MSLPPDKLILRIEVAWPSGKRSLIEEAKPNCLYIIDEAGAKSVPSSPTPEQPKPVYRDVSELVRHVHHEEAFDDFERQPLLSRRLSQLGPGVAWCDVNGDGWMDLVIGSGRGGELSLYLNDGHGGFRAVDLPGFKQAAVDDQTGIVGWTVEPGRSRLLVGMANYESGRSDTAAVLQHESSLGTWSDDGVAGGESSVGPLAVADMDGDGNLELFVGGRVIGGKYPVAASSGVYRERGGKWEKDGENSAGLKGVGLVSGAVWTDLEGTGIRSWCWRASGGR